MYKTTVNIAKVMDALIHERAAHNCIVK